MDERLTRDSLDEFGQRMLWVSWSRLYEWFSCQQKSVFSLNGQGDTIKDGRRFLHGTLADRSMRRWLEQAEPQLAGQMEAYVDDAWQEHVVDNPEYKIMWKGDVNEDQNRIRNIAKTVVRNVEPFLFEKVLPFDYEPEYRFQIPITIPNVGDGLPRTIVLNGGSDIVVREPNGHVNIYDLKATTNENYISKGIMPQLIFYSIALTLIFGTKQEDMSAAFLTPACKVQYHPLNITSQDRRYLMTRIIDFSHFVWSKQEPVCTTNESTCFFCDKKRICPKFATVNNTNEKGKNTVSLIDTAKQRRKAKEDAANAREPD